jgi:collagenase-like PrtC family protease
MESDGLQAWVDQVYETVQEYRERLTAGSSMEPEPYWDQEPHRWAAWDYDPGGDDTDDVLVEFQAPETG